MTTLARSSPAVPAVAGRLERGVRPHRAGAVKVFLRKKRE
jgi:hypothetical protein